MRWRLLVVLIIGCSGEVTGTDDAPLGGGGGGGGGGDGASPDVPGGVGEPAELMGITLLHNQVRAQIQTQPPLAPLEWDAALAQTAAAWVAQCRDQEAPAGLIDHNPDRSQGHPYYVGENIYASSGNATAQGAVQAWASEAANYNYANNTCSGICGHYTQIVWRSTAKLGCAKGDCPSLQFRSTIVCNYGPGGNVGGQRPY
jgi:pathogenesis-related protein 1